MSVLNPIPTEAKVPDSIILNSRRFADAQNSSYLPVAGRFNGDIIWAKDLGFKNKELFKAFPNRKYYLADYETVSIVSYDLK